MDTDIATIPLTCTLDGFAAEADPEDGLAIDSIEPGVSVIARTRHSTYRLVVLDVARCTVLVQGGNQFPNPMPAVLQGSTAGGNIVKTGWIGVGLHMELWVGRRRIVTSPVTSITLEF
jgi:hypothetical protein